MTIALPLDEEDPIALSAQLDVAPTPMHATTSAPPIHASVGSRLAARIRRHPLIAYFMLAFVGTWAFWLPMALQRDTHALAVLQITIPPMVQLVAFMLGVWAGPLLAALTVTLVTAGRSGVRQLLWRCVDWRVGLHWYLVITLGFISAMLLGFSLVYGVNLGAALLAQPAVLLSTYLVQLAFNFPTANVQEEIGWRGVALPRLQARYGPIVATVILGALHSLWHLPALFTPLLGPTNVPHFAGFVAVGIGTTFVFTWIFNHTRGSVLLAALAHGGLNAAVGMAAVLIPAGVVVPAWTRPLPQAANGDQMLVFGTIVVLLLVFTRGRLGYQPGQVTDLLAASGSHGTEHRIGSLGVEHR